MEVCEQLWQFLAAMLESELQQNRETEREQRARVPQASTGTLVQSGSLVSVHLLQVYSPINSIPPAFSCRRN